MRTVKEISRITGISVRTLHYYDEIGLLKPTAVSEAGYRLYDDKALEALRQILFFREFDMPLKEIRAILENPDFDKTRVLQSQKKMLELKRERLDRLIASIDGILKGDESMNFEVFDKEDIEEIYQSICRGLTEEQKKALIEEYGSLGQYEEHFKEEASSKQVQKNWAKVVEWYGDKETAKEAMTQPCDAEVMEAYRRRVGAVMEKLAAKIGTDVRTFAVRELVGELDFSMRQLFRLKEAEAFMLELAESYEKDEAVRKAQDMVYGEGASVYMAQAIRAFYQR